MSGARAGVRELLAAANRLHADRQYHAAIDAYRLVLSRDNDRSEAWYGLAMACETILEYGDAASAFRRALTLRPDAARLRVNLGKVLFGLGMATEALRAFQRAETEGDDAARALARANVACLAPGDPAHTNQTIMDARRRWAETCAAGVTAFHPTWRPGEKLRIGYYGSYFGSKNWMKMCMGVLNAHDRDRFELHVIADGAAPSPEAGYRDHPDDRIWEVGGLSNEALAGHIADAKFDVLIDINGYSLQDRMPLLCWRAAPVQIAWMGMYGTTGFSQVDCVIGDAAAIPPEEDVFCVERVRRVPHTYLAFEVFYETPAVAPPPYLAKGHVTFGSLNSAYKLNDEVIASWSRILNGVPGAKLLLSNKALAHGSNRANVLSRFAACGIGAESIILEGGGEHCAFLRTYDRIDIALDVFPYNGGTTTAEAIWQGVPVLTFNGDRWASRTSRSILRAAGLEDWCAPDKAGFEEMASRMGRSPEPLAALRAGQRAKVAASPACDAGSLCRELEDIYRQEVAAKFS